jgi:hypothetical protein
MKWILVYFLLFSVTLTAQTERGSWTIGGTLGFSYYPDEPVYSIYIFPEAGYFVRKGLLVGLKPGWGYTRQETDFTGVFQSRSYVLLPTVQYIWQATKVIAPFGGLAYGWNRDLAKSERDSINRDYNSTLFEFNIGAILFLNKYIGIENALVYQRQVSEPLLRPRKDWTFRISVRAFLPQKNSKTKAE